jgi:hypothetical protein
MKLAFRDVIDISLPGYANPASEDDSTKDNVSYPCLQLQLSCPLILANNHKSFIFQSTQAVPSRLETPPMNEREQQQRSAKKKFSLAKKITKAELNRRTLKTWKKMKEQARKKCASPATSVIITIVIFFIRLAGEQS